MYLLLYFSVLFNFLNQTMFLFSFFLLWQFKKKLKTKIWLKNKILYKTKRKKALTVAWMWLDGLEVESFRLFVRILNLLCVDRNRTGRAHRMRRDTCCRRVNRGLRQGRDRGRVAGGYQGPGRGRGLTLTWNRVGRSWGGNRRSPHAWGGCWMRIGGWYGEIRIERLIQAEGIGNSAWERGSAGREGGKMSGGGGEGS